MRNQSAAKFYPVLFLALTVLVIFLSIRAASPPPPLSDSAPDTVFSAERAMAHLKEISRAPHSLGTAEHERVRNYIINQCRQLGMETSVQNSTVLRYYSQSIAAANVYNITGIIRGQRRGKAILNIAHYDSQPNSPGAADDGMGVAAMLETARAAKTLRTMQNDMIFLFSDGEEQGLFGAKAFIDENPEFNNVGVAINWDFRGNTGIAINYETSGQNGWLMRRFAEGAKYPFANSMGYEISKRMPNDSDFRLFREAGVTGFANALLGGYPYYHNMTDNTRNIDKSSIQQVGDNMLGMVSVLGNISLADTKAPDLSYFNIIGSCLIYYPALWNLFFAIVVTVLYLIITIYGFRKREIKLPGFILSFIALPITLVTAYAGGTFFLKMIFRQYPLYSHFYANTSYNSHWYFIAFTMIALLVFTLAYQPILRKFGHSSSFAGILLFNIIAMWIANLYVATATWLLFVPLFFLLLAYGYELAKTRLNPTRRFNYYLGNFVSVLPALLLFIPLTYLIFLSFGLGSTMPLIGALVILIASLIYPVLTPVFSTAKWLLPVILIAGIAFSLLQAHLGAGFDSAHPLPTNVSYRLNTSDSAAVWLSDMKETDAFSSKFFPGKKTKTNYREGRRLVNTAPLIPYDPPSVSIASDSLQGEKRILTLRITPSRPDVHMMGLVMDKDSCFEVRNITINTGMRKRADVKNDSPCNRISIYGTTQEGFDIQFVMGVHEKIGFTAFSQSMGLPPVKGLTEYPENIMPGAGFTSNTTKVEKHFEL